MEGKGPRGKKDGGQGGQRPAANVVEAKNDDDDGVWAVVDEREEFSDWEIADDSEIDWAFLSDFEPKEDEDLPAHSTIPDAHPADAERLHSIMLDSWDIRDAFLRGELDASSIPPLQPVSESEDSTGPMPGLQSISGTEYSFDENPSPDLETASCSNSSIRILPDDNSEPSMFWDDEPITTSFAGAALAGTAQTQKSESDLYDSGASRHMTPFKHRLINYTPIASRPITAADKRVFQAIGKGDMQIRIPNGTTTTTVLLKDVLYAPDMGLTIISVSRVTAAGFAVLFRANFCRIFDLKHKRIGHVHVTSNGLYRVDHDEVVSSASTKTKLTLLELHQRMGHIAPDAVRKLVADKHIVGVELEDDGERWGPVSHVSMRRQQGKG